MIDWPVRAICSGILATPRETIVVVRVSPFLDDSCMVTKKTVTLEIDAYEKLKAAKRNSRESFSSLVRRAVFPDQATTAGALREATLQRVRRGNKR